MQRYVQLATASALAAVALGQTTDDITSIVDVDVSAASCYFWTNWALYDMKDLKKTGGYNYFNTYFWNYCAYVNLPANNTYNTGDTYAYVLNPGQPSNMALPMTDDYVIVEDVEQIAANATQGTLARITYTQESNVTCIANANRTNSFVSTVVCDSTVIGNGTAQISSAFYNPSTCEMFVTVSHAAGCPVMDLSSISTFLVAAKWIIAILFIFTGPVIGMVGKRWFPWMVACMGGVASTLAFLMVCTVAGWMSSAAGFWCLLITGICLGVLGGWLLKKAVWFEIGLLGVLGGFFLATFLYSFIVAASGWDSPAFYWTFTSILMITCGLLSWKFARLVVMVCTSGIGAYLFCRGFGYLFGGWPSEAALMGNGIDFVNFGTAFWIYMTLMLFLWVFFTVWQIKKEAGNDDSELEDHFKKVENVQQED